MQMTDTLALAADTPVAVVIDLIGDLDATLGAICADALANAIDAGATDILLMTKHVTATSQEGIAAIDGAMGSARELGRAVSLEPGNRRMKAAFAAARVAVASGATPLSARRARHLMIAHHAAKPTLARTA
jgi:anti-anti-sigma regulatory factor